MRLIVFVLFLGIITSSSLPAQYMSSSQLSGIGVPFFHAGVFRTFSDNPQDSLRQVKIYFQINKIFEKLLIYITLLLNRNFIETYISNNSYRFY